MSDERPAPDVLMREEIWLCFVVDDLRWHAGWKRTFCALDNIHHSIRGAPSEVTCDDCTAEMVRTRLLMMDGAWAE